MQTKHHVKKKKKKKKKRLSFPISLHITYRVFSLFQIEKKRKPRITITKKVGGVVEDNVDKVILLCTRKSLIVLRISFNCFFIKMHLFFLSITLYQPCRYRWIFHFSLVLHSFINLVFLVLLFAITLTWSPILIQFQRSNMLIVVNQDLIVITLKDIRSGLEKDRG